MPVPVYPPDIDGILNPSVFACTCPASGGMDHSGEYGPVVDLETAQRLYDEGYAVCPTSGVVWDKTDCPDCGGTGEYRHNPCDDWAVETLNCSNCGGDGWVPEKDYTRGKELAPETVAFIESALRERYKPAGCEPCADLPGVFVATAETMEETL